MTGNLGKFSTEPAADGGGIKTKGESNKREKKRDGRREGRVRWGGGGDVRRLPDMAGVRSESKAANGFPDSNQRRGVGWEVGGCSDGRRRRKQGRKSSC